MRKPLTRVLPAVLLAAALGLSTTGEALAQGATPAARRELAPTGVLRLAMTEGNRNIATRDPASGELRGPGIELGRDLARRLGVPFEPVGYRTAMDVADALRAGQVDAAFLGLDPARAPEFDVAPPYIADDWTYIVPATSPLRAAADADRLGVRIAAPPGGVIYLTLQRELRSAELVAMERPEVWAALAAGTVHAHAFSRSTLVEDTAQRPGLRVVEGRFGVSEIAVAIPTGRPAALAFATQVVEQAKATGLIQQAIARAGLAGAQVPPPARGLRLPATGAAPTAAGPAAPALFGAALVLAAGLAALTRDRATRRRRVLTAAGHLIRPAPRP